MRVSDNVTIRMPCGFVMIAADMDLMYESISFIDMRLPDLHNASLFPSLEEHLLPMHIYRHYNCHIVSIVQQVVMPSLP
jgi:hypothetical protein